MLVSVIFIVIVLDEYTPNVSSQQVFLTTTEASGEFGQRAPAFEQGPKGVRRDGRLGGGSWCFR